MKTLTTELKQRFFAQYIGQRFVLKIDNPNVKHEYSAEIYFGAEFLSLIPSGIDQIFPILLLRPLSQITDEEAIEVSKILLSHRSITEIMPGELIIEVPEYVEEQKQIIIRFSLRCLEGAIEVDSYGSINGENEDGNIINLGNHFHAYQYLLSRGFLWHICTQDTTFKPALILGFTSLKFEK